MNIRIGFEMTFSTPAPTPIVALLYVHPDISHRLQEPERLIIDPAVTIEDFTDSFGNRAGRFVARPGKLTLRYDNVIEDTGEPEPAYPTARQHRVEELPTDTLQFLLASRYCEVDRMLDLSWDLFGKTPQGWLRVQAICDWVYNHIEFGYPYASPTKSAWEVYEDGRGVCRDYMHLAITFCRCMNIPARYATGYLGDIAWPVTGPMDFSAFFEVFLDGRWHPFDARNNARRIGRVVMARGRDAADTALTTSFTPLLLENFVVVSDEIRTEGGSVG